MTAHAQTMDSHGFPAESLRGSFVASIVLHVALAGGALIYTFWQSTTEQIGDANAGGNAVGVEAVDKIPLVTRGQHNPVANDTKSPLPQTPPPPKPEVKPKAKEEPEDALPMKLEQKKTQAQVEASRSKYRSFDELEPNRLTLPTAQAMSDPLYALSGSGDRIGESNTTLGSRFAAYGAQVKQLVARAWHTQDVPANIKAAMPVIATFDIQRNGTVTSVRLLQKSGISSLDLSVERAIREASPFPPLPAQFEKDTATVEFSFELKR